MAKIGSPIEAGRNLVNHYADITGMCKGSQQDRCDLLAYALADLMHWADSVGVNFEKELERAREHFKVEDSYRKR